MSVNTPTGNIDQTTPISNFVTLTELAIDQYLLGINNIVQGDGSKIKFGNLIQNIVSADADNMLEIGTDGKLTAKAGLFGLSDGWAVPPNLTINWQAMTVSGTGGVFNYDGVEVAALKNFTSPTFSFDSATVQYLYYNAQAAAFTWSIDKDLAGTTANIYPICSVASILKGTAPVDSDIPTPPDPSNPTQSTSPSTTTSGGELVPPPPSNQNGDAESNDTVMLGSQTWGLSGTENSVVTYLDNAVGLVLLSGGDIGNIELNNETKINPSISTALIGTATFNQTIAGHEQNDPCQIIYWDKSTTDPVLRILEDNTGIAPNSNGKLFYSGNAGWAELATDNFMNIHLVAIPYLDGSEATSSAYLWIAGEESFATLEAAQAAKANEVVAFKKVQELFPRLVHIYDFTMKKTENNYVIAAYSRTSENAGTSGGGETTTIMTPKIGTVVFSPFPIDETDGTLKAFSGQWVNYNANLVGFFKWLDKYYLLYPEKFETSPAQWAADLEAKGYNDKFLYDGDFDVEKRGWSGSMRMPSLPNGFAYNFGVPSIPVVGNGLTLGFRGAGSSGVTYAGFTFNNDQANNSSYRPNAYGAVVGTVVSTPLVTWTQHSAIGITQDSDKSGLIANCTAVNQKIANSTMYWGIVVAQNIKEAEPIIDSYELNNPFFFGQYIYSSVAPDNLSWIKGGLSYPRSTYTPYCDWVQGQIAKGAKYFKGITGYAFNCTNQSAPYPRLFLSMASPIEGAWAYDNATAHSPVVQIGTPSATGGFTCTINDTVYTYETSTTDNITQVQFWNDFDWGLNNSDITNITFKLPSKVENTPIDATLAKGEYPVVGNGNCLGFTDGSSVGGLYPSSATNAGFLTDSLSLAGVPAGSTPSGTRLTNGLGLGITTNSALSGLIAKYPDLSSASNLWFYVGEVAKNPNIINAAQMQSWMINNQIKQDELAGNFNYYQIFSNIASINWDGTNYGRNQQFAVQLPIPKDGYPYLLNLSTSSSMKVNRVNMGFCIKFYGGNTQSQSQAYYSNLHYIYNTIANYTFPTKNGSFFAYYDPAGDTSTNTNITVYIVFQTSQPSEYTSWGTYTTLRANIALKGYQRLPKNSVQLIGRT